MGYSTAFLQRGNGLADGRARAVSDAHPVEAATINKANRLEEVAKLGEPFTELFSRGLFADVAVFYERPPDQTSFVRWYKD